MGKDTKNLQLRRAKQMTNSLPDGIMGLGLLYTTAICVVEPKAWSRLCRPERPPAAKRPHRVGSLYT